uniref:Uncharacterized protein n=1 Tax=Aegilops tauschii subsp. strangulata TaxID=200361 RepID=A0A453E9F1_AEGTS
IPFTILENQKKSRKTLTSQGPSALAVLRNVQAGAGGATSRTTRSLTMEKVTPRSSAPIDGSLRSRASDSSFAGLVQPAAQAPGKAASEEKVCAEVAATAVQFCALFIISGSPD